MSDWAKGRCEELSTKTDGDRVQDAIALLAKDKDLYGMPDNELEEQPNRRADIPEGKTLLHLFNVLTFFSFEINHMT